MINANAHHEDCLGDLTPNAAVIPAAKVDSLLKGIPAFRADKALGEVLYPPSDVDPRVLPEYPDSQRVDEDDTARTFAITSHLPTT